MDESVTGSANSCAALPVAAAVSIVPVHLRPPALDHGVVSFLWGFGLGLFIWLGLLAVGVSGATAFIFAALSAAGIFFFVRLFGEEDLRRR